MNHLKINFRKKYNNLNGKEYKKYQQMKEIIFLIKKILIKYTLRNITSML
jgi:hypothetical protein